MKKQISVISVILLVIMNNSVFGGVCDIIKGFDLFLGTSGDVKEEYSPCRDRFVNCTQVFSKGKSYIQLQPTDIKKGDENLIFEVHNKNSSIGSVFVAAARKGIHDTIFNNPEYPGVRAKLVLPGQHERLSEENKDDAATTFKVKEAVTLSILHPSDDSGNIGWIARNTQKPLVVNWESEHCELATPSDLHNDPAFHNWAASKRSKTGSKKPRIMETLIYFIGLVAEGGNTKDLSEFRYKQHEFKEDSFLGKQLVKACEDFKPNNPNAMMDTPITFKEAIDNADKPERLITKAEEMYLEANPKQVIKKKFDSGSYETEFAEYCDKTICPRAMKRYF